MATQKNEANSEPSLTPRSFTAAVFDVKGIPLLRMSRQSGRTFVYTTQNELIGTVHANRELWRWNYALHQGDTKFAGVEVSMLLPKNFFRVALLDETGQIMVCASESIRKLTL